MVILFLIYNLKLISQNYYKKLAISKTFGYGQTKYVTRHEKTGLLYT